MRSLALLLVLVLLGTACQAPTSSPSQEAGPIRVQPDASLTLPATAGWYKDQVFYHVWLKAFRDSNGDGIGDLSGVTQELDYLHNLGVTALWLSPFLANASGTANLHGYDVTDHYRVDPRFGSLADVKALLAAAHSRGMRVIFDFVPNHVSNQHSWFRDSLAGRNDKRDWFVWRSSPPTQGWQSIGGGAAGSGFHHASNGLYYYGVFWDGMPDLNYRNPAVSSAMTDVVKYWLNQGFDGLRVDAVKYLYENETTGANADQPETFAWFQDLREKVLNSYEALGDAKFMVAENWTGDPANLRAYLHSGGRDGFQATLDFPLGQTITSVLNDGQDPSALQTLYDSWVSAAVADGGWSMSFLNNHDNYLSRPRTSFGSDQKTRVAQALQMTAWGTPILYYGNEIGMTGLVGSDVNLRTNFDWGQVAAAQANPDSLYQWQQTLDQLRATRASLRRGDYHVVASTAGTVAVVRTLGTESTLLVANLTPATLDSVTVTWAGTVADAPTTLVGDGSLSPSAGQATLTGLKGYGVRVYALEGTGVKLRGDFTDGPPPTTVWAYAKDASGAGLTVAFYDASGTLLAQPATNWNGNCLWYASTPYPGDATSGYVQWFKASSSYQSGLLPFGISVPGQDTVATVPPYNTGSAATWFLRGISGNWNTGVALSLDGTGAGHFVATLSPSQAPATGVTFKINASATAWDYFFGYGDLVYDNALGDDPATLGFASAGGADRNFSFVPDGTSSYEVHFWNDLGSCRMGIKKIVS